MKRVLLIVFISIGWLNIFSQQSPMFTQYYFNPFVINPAIAGTNNYYQIRTNNRFQWVGFGDGPITNCLSVYGPHGSKKFDMGYGANIMSDITGPTSRLAVNGSYAYNFAISNDIRLSLGANFGILQYKIDGTQLTLPDTKTPDPTLNTSVVYSTIVPDASIGGYLYSTNFNVGFAANQLFNNKIKFEEKDALNRLKTHFYLTGFYKYYVNRDFQLEPGVIIKAVRPAPIQVDLTIRVIYQNMVSGGIAFRSKDAFSVMVGYTYDNKISIAYAYDVGVTAIRKYNSGSHEIMLAYRFNPMK